MNHSDLIASSRFKLSGEYSRTLRTSVLTIEKSHLDDSELVQMEYQNYPETKNLYVAEQVKLSLLNKHSQH
ncbi:hypothetical protein M8J75_000068 [Diaphorina citri]|nr:hypothetical protein M8J75_000068 [Diaphorina citri]